MTFSSYGFPTAKGSYPVLSQVKVFVQGPGPHLWFNLLSGAGCGEVDAATRMPAAIFEPSNQAALDAYIKVTLRDYGSRFALKVGRCVDRGYTDYSRTATSTSFWTISRAHFSYVPPYTRRGIHSTWCPC